MGKMIIIGSEKAGERERERGRREKTQKNIVDIQKGVESNIKRGNIFFFFFGSKKNRKKEIKNINDNNK